MCFGSVADSHPAGHFSVAVEDTREARGVDDGRADKKDVMKRDETRGYTMLFFLPMR